MYGKNSCVRRLCLMLVLAAICLTGYAQDHFIEPTTRQVLVEQTKFIQIPGPNPIIRTGPEGAWDERMLEASDAFRDVGTYYFYYHAIGRNEGEEDGPAYQVGVASADHPLGPFKKHGDGPVLKVGPKGSWDDRCVACAMVMKADDEDDDTYYMWYSGIGRSREHRSWGVGLATAEDPLGPWKKYEGNPIIEDFGYVGGVVKVDGKYRLYSAHPISWEGHGYKGDYSPLAVAIGETPEGPFVKYGANPLMERGNTGDWDDDGISEAEVLYHNGMFHMFYGGTEINGPRLESVGYAYSFDGFKWFKYGRNPVAKRQANPNAAAFAEVHAIIEPPFVYVYHTLRPEHHGGRDYPWVEDLGVQVLVTETPFSLDMPVLNLDSLGAGETSADSEPISLGHVKKAALTVECTNNDEAEKPLIVLAYASYDGINYDVTSFLRDKVFRAGGGTARKTFNLDTNARFIKVRVVNSDKAHAVSNVKVTASLSG